MKINTLKNKYNIYLTKSATKQLLYLLEKNNTAKGIQITIKKTGCAGFKYHLSLITQIFKKDIKIFKKKIKFYIPKKWILYIQNITIDYLKKGLNSIFIFKNSKTKNLCGCGESFQI
ncbi:iron-sulfur cluster assembly accessory protein [Buchnera aphidicola]|uniref:iron-sulfur cluster assembly accessory protein n=1 Tax=Buchnera aphidicola TaxID=9 RepID=UPI0031B6C547